MKNPPKACTGVRADVQEGDSAGIRGLCFSVRGTGFGKRMGQTGGPDSLGHGGARVREAVCGQRTSGAFGANRAGGTHHQTAAEMQRRVDGTPCEREPLSPVLSRNEGVQLKGSLWGIHHGGVPQAFSARDHCDDSGGQHTKETPSGS